MSASTKPRTSITSASSTYITPMRLWSTLVIHSRHRYGHQPLTVTSASRPERAPSTTTTPADQRDRLVERNGGPGQLAQHRQCIAMRGGTMRPRRLRRAMACEQPGDDRARRCDAAQAALGPRELRRRPPRRACRPRRARLATQCCEVAGATAHDVEAHVGEPVAAELRRQARVDARADRPAGSAGRHAGHGVDLAAELRHEEAVHHAGRSELEVASACPPGTTSRLTLATPVRDR